MIIENFYKTLFPKFISKSFLLKSLTSYIVFDFQDECSNFFNLVFLWCTSPFHFVKRYLYQLFNLSRYHYCSVDYPKQILSNEKAKLINNHFGVHLKYHRRYQISPPKMNNYHFSWNINCKSLKGSRFIIANKRFCQEVSLATCRITELKTLLRSKILSIFNAPPRIFIWN